MTLNELFSSIAEAIRGKRNSTAEIVASNFAAEIDAIYTGQDATGTSASNILKDKIVCINGSKVVGTMPDNGAISQTLAVNGSYTIPAGYHNGSGKVSQSLTTKAATTYTPTTSDQTIAAGQYLSGAQTIKGDANLVSANILSGKTIFGVSGNSNVVNTSAGTATAAQILSGKIAFVDGKQVTGTIASKAAATYTPSTSNQTIAAGQYLSGAQTIKGDANLKASNIASGVSIFGVAGTLAAGYDAYCTTYSLTSRSGSIYPSYKNSIRPTHAMGILISEFSSTSSVPDNVAFYCDFSDTSSYIGIALDKNGEVYYDNKSEGMTASAYGSMSYEVESGVGFFAKGTWMIVTWVED